MDSPHLSTSAGRPAPGDSPTLDAVSGPSFPIAIKLMASALILAVVVFGWLALTGPSGTQAGTLAATEWGFVIAAVAAVAAGYWGIMTSRTRCDGECIEQTWLWRKRVRIADISQLKLISIPGLDWIVVPRLVVRTGFGFTTFHAGDPAVLARFRQLAYGQ